MTLIKVQIIKCGLNPDSNFATLQNDLSINDNHPNVKSGDSRIGHVNIDRLFPVLGIPYAVFGDKIGKAFITSHVKKIYNPLSFATENSLYMLKILTRLIDYKYNVDYTKVNEFTFDKKNKIVDFSNYKVLELEIDRVSEILKKDATSRRALIVLSDNTPSPSCLISLQYLIEDDVLYCIVNYRSQHIRYGYPYDVKLLNYLTTRFINNVNRAFKQVEIKVSVADYHDYDIENG